MHNKLFINYIEEAARPLNIEVEHFIDNYAIELRKDDIIEYIIGYLFPLNNSTSAKIANNKNLCSEILSKNNIPNVPHEIIFSPHKLIERKNNKGNLQFLNNLVLTQKFPLVLKKNNSSKGVGVYLVKNELELEKVIYQLYASEDAFCISPYRKDLREFRNIILDGQCMLTYEKKIPFIVGDGKNSVLFLLADFLTKEMQPNLRIKNLFDNSIASQFPNILPKNKILNLQWQHNRFLGTRYEKIEDNRYEKISIDAAKAIGSRFVSVDVIETEDFGVEVLEINASVIIHNPIYISRTKNFFSDAQSIYSAALMKLFNI